MIMLGFTGKPNRGRNATVRLAASQAGGAIQSTPRGCPEGEPEHGRPITPPGSLPQVVAWVERGAPDGEGDPGGSRNAGALKPAKDLIPWVPHQAGLCRTADLSVVGS